MSADGGSCDHPPLGGGSTRSGGVGCSASKVVVHPTRSRAVHASDLPWRGGRAAFSCCAGLAAILLGLAGILLQPIWDDATLRAPAPTVLLADRNGAFLTQIGHETRDAAGARQIDYGYWPLKTLPERVVRATLALEDRRFDTHPGVDVLAVARAAWRNAVRRHRTGASTIAMQVARMQTPAPRTFVAKLREGATALALTMRYGREAVLAHYLRLVPYGNNSHGIVHAARLYFDKPVDDLSFAEIALLAAIPQSPTLLNPLNAAGLARAKTRGHRALDQLARHGVMDAAGAALAHRQLAAMRAPPVPRRPDALHAVLRYEALAREGRLAIDPTDPRLTATLDLQMQDIVASLAQKYLRAWRTQGAEQVAALVVERRSGHVLASVGSGDYRDRHGGALDFTSIARSPGSTLKPFIYALALERGSIRASDPLADLPEGAAAIANADGQFLGPMLPRQALANSRNVPATNLLRRIGLGHAFGFLHALRLHDQRDPADAFGLSMAIGSLPTTLEKLVRAYGALAEDGVLADLTWIQGQRRREPARVLSVDTARLVTSMLADASARLPTFPRYGAMDYPFPVALKTGTSQAYRDAWTVAWSRDLLVGVWVGRADAGTTARLSGAGSAARLVHAILLRLHNAKAGDLQDTAFPAPPGRVPVELCMLSGRNDDGCGQMLTEWVTPDEASAIVHVTTATGGPSLKASARDEGACVSTQQAHNAVDSTALLPEGECRPALVIPAAYRAWAQAAGYRVAADTMSAARLAIVAPENETRFWINPETPAGTARISLKAQVSPRVPQVVWYVDGAPFALSDPDLPVTWPLTKGAHRLQVRLPLQTGASNEVHIVVE